MEKRINMNSLVLCAMSFIVLASSATSPALSAIAENFPNAKPEAIASIATLSSITALPFTILSGVLVGKKIKFKAMASLGLIITTIGGVLPYFSNSITEVLFGRAILGIGTGLLGPIVSTLTLSLFTGENIAKQFSRNMMATSFGAVIFQLAGGYLCELNWRMPFVSYLIVLPVLLMVLLLLKEPSIIITNNSKVQKIQKNSIRDILTKHVIFWGALYGVYMIFFYPYVTETSGIIVNSSYGSSMSVAVVLSLFTAFGIIGGYLFYPLNNKFKIHVLSIGFFIGFLSYVWLIFANSIISFAIASCVFGIGYGTLGPSLQYYLGKGLKPETRAASIATASLFQHVGSFGSPFVIGFIRRATNSSWNRLQFAVGAVFFIFATLLFLFWKKNNNVKE